MRRDAEAIVARALSEVDAAAAVERVLRLDGSVLRAGPVAWDAASLRRLVLAGAGKAAASMAAAVERILGDRVEPGLVVVKDGHAREGLRCRVREAAHPIPDDRSLRAGEEMRALLEGCDARDGVIFVLSGGASALLEALPAGVGLEDLQRLTRLLLESGATIDEINTVRRALSRVKAGGLLQAARPARILVLVLSDIPGNPLDRIGSGPFVPGASRAAAVEALRRRDLLDATPPALLRWLSVDASGPGPGAPGMPPGEGAAEERWPDLKLFHVEHVVVGDSRRLAEAAAEEGRRRGYAPLVLTTSLAGEARDVARVLAAIAREVVGSGHPVAPPACIVASGETTVTVRGRGRGGRNTELALAFAIAARGLEPVVLASVASDGTDGPTDNAGAIVDGCTVERGASRGLDALGSLSDNDSLSFLEATGEAITTGPTGTNVDDLQVLLVGAPDPARGEAARSVRPSGHRPRALPG